MDYFFSYQNQNPIQNFSLSRLEKTKQVNETSFVGSDKVNNASISPLEKRKKHHSICNLVSSCVYFRFIFRLNRYVSIQI